MSSPVPPTPPTPPTLPAAVVVVRDATREDMPLIHTMIHRIVQELAAFEGMPEGPALSVDDLIEDGFSSGPAWFFALVGELEGRVVGYALCNRAYSSWTRRALYLEDLYVRAAWRRRGVARALLARLCALGVTLGATRLDWHVLERNAAARALYASLGARDLRLSEGRAALRLDAPAIAASAAADTSSTRSAHASQ